jgi:DNA-binding beta-propeller fold protein YncE
MKTRPTTQIVRIAVVLLFCIPAITRSQEKTEAPLKLLRSVALPGFTGDFDHFAVDEKGGRLFLAGEDHKTVEVFDLKTGQRLKSIAGFGAPHTIFYLPKADRILITDGDKGQVQILRGSDYSFVDHIDGLPGVDSARIDAASNILYVVTGGKDVGLSYSFLIAIDLQSRKKVGELRFESNHVEAFALESSSPRLFINITDKNEVDVVDRKVMRVTARWPIRVAETNSPMAYDETHHRLLIVCRSPGMLVVMDSDTGKIVANIPAAGHSDDIAFDPSSARIYVPGGDGYTSVFHQDNADKYSLIANVPTAQGAKTSLLMPPLKQYFIAVSPGESKALAKVLTFQVQP